MKRKKIAFIIPSLEVGGAERVVSTLANKLITYFDVTIISYYKCVPFYSLDKQINIHFCATTYRKESNVFQSFNTHFKLFRNTFKLLKANDSDLIIGFMPTANIYAILCGKLLKKPSIICERANPKYNSISSLWVKLCKRLYPLSTKLVVQTESIKPYFKSFIKEQQLDVLKNPLSENLIVHRNLDSKKESIILNVGRLSASKNQDLLIKAFANIDRKDWKLIIIGDGDYKKELEKLIASLGLKDSILLKEPTNEVYNFYNKAKIFAFTSKHEGFPNALTEALYFGLACISTNCDFGPSELIKDSMNGYLIPVGDQKLLEARLIQLMNNSELRQSFSENAVVSTKSFQPDLVAEHWKHTINNVIKMYYGFK